MRRRLVTPAVFAGALVLAGCAGPTGSTPTPAETPALTPTLTPLPLASSSPTTAPTAQGEPTATLPPEGSWQVDLSAYDLSAAGWPADVTGPGTYTWTFTDARARLDVDEDAGLHLYCDADMEPTDEGFRLTYDAYICNGEVDEIGWALEDDGLHLTLITTNGPSDQQNAYLETKPWQSIEVGSVPGPRASEPPWLGRCELGCQGPVAAGTFESADFIPGLQMDFPNGSWFNTADFHDEIQFEFSGSTIRFFQTARAASGTGELLSDVPGTVEGLTDWFVSNSDFVVSDPEQLTIGDGIDATTFTFDLSDSNPNSDPGCPVHSCREVLWIGEHHKFGIGIGSGERLYLFNYGEGDDAKTIVVSLDTHKPSLGDMTTKLHAMLQTLHLP